METCEDNDCPYWSYDAGTEEFYCDDKEVFVSSKTGYPCCRYNLNAVPINDYKKGECT